MLKSLNQPRLSPTSVSVSPRFQDNQYAAGAASPRVSSNTASRRVSVPSPSPILISAPPPRQVKYVSRGTQYSPIIGKMNDLLQNEPPLVKPAPTQHEEEGASKDVAPAPTSPPPEPVLPAESPTQKKRHIREETSSIISVSQAVPPKRVRSAHAPVKVLPRQYEFCAVEDMVILIAHMISELIETNDGLPLRTGVLTRFHSRTPPGISVLDYLQRLAKHATLTPPLLLSMVYYIDRLCSLYPAFTINTLTVHRFLITAATVAAKGLSDSFWNNATYARVGGIKIAELGLLELDFLYRVDWKIVPNPEVLVDYYKGLVERADGYELEGTSKTLDNDADDEDTDEPETPDIKMEGATDMKWKEWMDDVSTQRAGTNEDSSQKNLKDETPIQKIIKDEIQTSEAVKQEDSKENES